MPLQSTVEYPEKRAGQDRTVLWPSEAPGAADDGSTIETDADRVEGPEEEPAAAFVMIGPIELVPDRVDRERPEWLGREGEWPGPHEPQSEQIGVRAEDEVPHNAAGPATGADAEPGVAERVGGVVRQGPDRT